ERAPDDGRPELPAFDCHGEAWACPRRPASVRPRYAARMPDARSPLVAAGALNAALAVAAGAFAAHGLRERLSTHALEIFETGARYHMYHALAMVLAGLVAARGASTAGWIFLAGIAIFSGSL